MRAVIHHRYGPPEVLQLAEVDKPDCGDAELLIRVKAAEVTKADCELRSFNFPVKWFWLPLRLVFGVFRPRRKILGGYFSGEIVKVGSQVSEYAVGDQIYGTATLKMGAYAEYLSLPADCTLVHKPGNLSYAEAAAVPLGGLNAWHFMNKAQIKRGDSVLINGAGGSIGLFALQIAKQRGAQVTVVDKGSKQAMLVSKGADRFINYTLQDFSLEGHEYDVVFDMVAQSSFEKCLNVVKPKGRLLLGNPTFPKMMKSLWISQTTDKLVSFAFAKESKDELKALNELLEEGKIAPVIDRVFSMHEAVQAHHRVQDEERVGMVVLSMEQQSPE